MSYLKTPMKPKTKIATALTALLMLMILTGVIVCVILFERTEKTILNANPYPCSVAVKYQSAPNTWKTIGWLQFRPGERKTVTATFFWVEPKFFVAAESHDAKLLSFLTEGGDGTVYFVGNDISGHAPKNRDIDLAEVEDENEVELEEIGFVRATAGEEIYILTDRLFQDAVLRNDGTEVGDEEEGFELIREKATHLYESLHRQKQFEETFKSESDYPFQFEFNMTDDPEQGFMYLGVTLTDVRSETLHGDQIQLRNGDVLIGIGSGEKPVTPIYATADAYIALHEHALDTENGGITKPLKFIIMRDKQLLQIESFYLFSPDFNWDDVSAGRAFFENGVNSLTLGFWPRIVAAFSDDPHALWKTNERLGRLKQFHPNATAIGGIVGLVAPTPTKFFKIGKGLMARRLLSSTVVNGISVEFLRLAVYTHNTSFPTPQSKQSTTNDLSKLFSTTPLNFVEGLYEEGVEPTFKPRSRGFGVTH